MAPRDWENGRISALKIALLIGLCTWGRPSHAFDMYMDGLGGLSFLSGMGSVLTDSQLGTVSGGSGLGIQLGAFVGLNRSNRPFRIHLGITTDYMGANRYQASYALLTLSPEIRFMLENVYLGFGATPWVWSRIRSDQSIDYFTGVKSAIGIQASAGYQWVITPEIAFITGASFHTISGAGGSPTWINAMIGFRLFYGNLKGGGYERTYDDYRYPGGWTK